MINPTSTGGIAKGYRAPKQSKRHSTLATIHFCTFYLIVLSVVV